MHKNATTIYYIEVLKPVRILNEQRNRMLENPNSHVGRRHSWHGKNSLILAQSFLSAIFPRDPSKLTWIPSKQLMVSGFIIRDYVKYTSKSHPTLESGQDLSLTYLELPTAYYLIIDFDETVLLI